eukprot:CCRYP_020366-RA/>CCRYP_020366-RA protein AED:0.29 eAED:0.29 QI:298/1/1/1/1/1/2/275/803
MRLVSSFLGFNSELSSRQSKSKRVSLLLDTSKSKRKETFKKKSTADEWIADARDEGSTRVTLSLEPSKSRKVASKKKVGTKELIVEDAREDANVVGSSSALDREDAERQGGEEFPAIHVGPYEEMLAGNGSFLDKSRRVKVKRQNVAAKDDRTRRFANELCHVLDQFVINDHSLINQVYDQSSVIARPKESTTAKVGVSGVISTDLDPQSIPLKKLVCGERYACADYIDDVAEGWKDMMRGAGGCSGNKIIEYIADWDGESYDSSTFESLNTIEAKIRQSLRTSVSIDSNDDTVESELSMSQCARSTSSYDENSCDEIEISAAEYNAVIETSTMDREAESRAPDVEWTCSSVGSVFTEMPTKSFIAEEPSIADDTLRDLKCIEIQLSHMSKGKSFGENEDFSVATNKPDAEESSVSKLVSSKNNAVLKSIVPTGKAQQDARGIVQLDGNFCYPTQNVGTETNEDAREDLASIKSADDATSLDDKTQSSLSGGEQVKSTILSHVVVVQASSEASVSMQLEEAGNLSDLDKEDRAKINAKSASEYMNTINGSNNEDVKPAGYGVQGAGELDQMYEAVAIEMKLSEESESSNISQRMNEICHDATGGADSCLQFDTNSSYPSASSLPPEQYDGACLDSTEKEASPSSQFAPDPLSGQYSEIEDEGVGGAVKLSTMPARAQPDVDIGTAQWAESNIKDMGLGRAALLSTIPAHTKTDVETGAAQWAQHIDWDSFLNDGIKSKSISSMSPAASKGEVLHQSERRIPTKMSLVKSFFGKTKKKRYCNKKVGEEAKHVSFAPYEMDHLPS